MGLYSMRHVISHRVLGYNDSYMILKICLLKEEIRVFKIEGQNLVLLLQVYLFMLPPPGISVFPAEREIAKDL